MLMQLACNVCAQKIINELIREPLQFSVPMVKKKESGKADREFLVCSSDPHRKGTRNRGHLPAVPRWDSRENYAIQR